MVLIIYSWMKYQWWHVMNCIKLVLHWLKQAETPFGGLNMIFAGDFAQLKPVFGSPLYSHTVGGHNVVLINRPSTVVVSALLIIGDNCRGIYIMVHCRTGTPFLSIIAPSL